MGVAPIKMPQLGESVTEGTVDRWLKKEGDFVKRDEPIVEVVTDKVNAEIPSPFEGTLVKISVAEGTTVNVGVEIAQIETEAAVEAAPAPVAAEKPAPAPAPAAAAPSPAPVPTPSADGARQRFSPAVRRLAEEHGIDPSTISGTGEGGRVTRDDVLAFVQKGGTPAAAAVASAAPARPAPAPAPPATPARPSPPRGEGEQEELVRISAVRRSIAEHMTRSLATSPHAWTLQEVDVTELVKYREAEKEGFRQRHGFTLTYLPFVAQVLCEALKEHPYLNSTWTDDGILLKKYVHLGIAVAYPDGLIVPVIHDADRMGFTDLARSMNDVVTRARSKQLKPEDVQRGTFTLNNTGATGSVASQPIINQPQAAILTTESILRRPVVIGEGIAVRSIMNMCLSFDHRIIDGQMSGQFVSWIKQRLESWTPSSLRL
ncbi:MAG TPA: dihydrolipoamide acetyltransferase family protein [Candidatus Dormibacteraeota bacterium]|jgi:2-oxoisovalerate dehydrogenase E2 component (dihydrolipoyl transacylase)